MNYFEYMADYIGSGAVRLPVVELSTALDIGAEPVNLSAADCSAMTAVASMGTPIVLKYMLNGCPIFSVACVAVIPYDDVHLHIYSASNLIEGNITIVVQGDPSTGEWKAFVTQE